MQRLRIDVTLATPVVMPRYPLHLDGLLAAARVHNECDGDWSFQNDLPLAWSREAGVWSASVVMPVSYRDVAPMSVHPMTRPFRAQDLSEARRRGAYTKTKVNVAVGPDRGYFFSAISRPIERLRAYCIGDADRVAALLGHISAVGGERRNGYGRITDAGWSVIWDGDAEHEWLVRTLPVEAAERRSGCSYGEASATVAPPYFARATRVAAAEPLVDTWADVDDG